MNVGFGEEGDGHVGWWGFGDVGQFLVKWISSFDSRVGDGPSSSVPWLFASGCLPYCWWL